MSKSVETSATHRKQSLSKAHFLHLSKEQTKPLVSIVTPVYNAEKYLEETIKSVQAQTYDRWELFLINDGSTDNSLEIAKRLAKSDKRIKIITIKNSGAAVARNTGIECARGRYLCFIDADDLWNVKKLEKQIRFMNKKECAFSFSGYEFGDENAVPNGKIVHVPSKINYAQALKNTTICTCTVMFDLQRLSKTDILMPTNTTAEDTATWWNVLKKVNYAYGMDENLFIYRRPKNSKSSNKFHAMKTTWKLYRVNEHLGILKASYCFVCYCFNAVRRRI